ncbi:hypothetical protein [Aeromicrobium sp.]|nr:hypothetical protein [Aeromicrobium sp.]
MAYGWAVQSERRRNWVQAAGVNCLVGEPFDFAGVGFGEALRVSE